MTKAIQAFTASRRQLLKQSLFSALALVSGTALASDHAKSHHHHMARNTSLVDAASDCIKVGQLCRDHCIELIKGGDTSVIDCLDAVTDTISMCETLVQLTVSDSRHLKSFAKVCREVCKDCEAECRKHEDKHQACKDCMLSCRDCIKQIEKVLA